MKRFLILIFIFFGVFLFTKNCLASELLIDNLDSYSVGSAGGQGNWHCDNANMVISNAQSVSAPNSLHDNSSTTYSCYNATGNALTTGTFTFNFYLASTAGSGYMQIYLYNSAGNYFILPDFEISAYGESQYYVKAYNGGTLDKGEAVSLDTWHTIVINFDLTTTGTYTYSFDGGAQSASKKTYGGCADGIDYCTIGRPYIYMTSAYPAYFDSFGTAEIVYDPCPANNGNPEWCNCTLPIFPKPDYCGQCLYDYNTATCQNIQHDIFNPAISLCQDISTEGGCTAVSYCKWSSASSECDFFKNLPITPETTNPDFGILGNAIRDLFLWAFVPGQEISYRWQELANTISGKMPFGYFYLVKSKLLDVSYTSTTAPAITTTANIFGGSHTFTFLDFSSLSTFVGSSAWNTIQTLISLGLWFSLIVYIYHRINELKL